MYEAKMFRIIGFASPEDWPIFVAAIHPPEAIREILDCLGLPSRAPPIARAVPEDADEPDI